jgi:hypothetical protein
LTRYYLDNSVHLERWTGDTPVRDEIAALLSGDEHVTSSHVLREWRHTVDGTAGDILNAIQGGAGDLSSVYARLSQGHRREPGQRLRVLAMLANQQREPSVVELRIRAQRLLRFSSKEMFLHKIKEVRNGSDCGLAKNEVKQGRDGRYSLVDRCRRKDEICRQDRFVEECRDKWKAASEGLVKHSDSKRAGDRKMGKLGLELLHDASKRKGKNCYAQTGDISISLECEPGETILTTDRSFEAMSKETGVQVKRIQATPHP